MRLVFVVARLSFIVGLGAAVGLIGSKLVRHGGEAVFRLLAPYYTAHVPWTLTRGIYMAEGCALTLLWLTLLVGLHRYTEWLTPAWWRGA